VPLMMAGLVKAPRRFASPALQLQG
jgi:hypothetical protein